MTPDTVVFALGGNAMLQPHQRGTASEQRENLAVTCAQMAEVIRSGRRVVITHGNGPQVGNILIQNCTADGVPAMPLDVCGAESQGMIGYMLQQALQNELLNGRTGSYPVCSVVTQVVVSRDDPAFDAPTKPVGPFCDRDHAERMMAEGENWVEVTGRGWRKVVPSPEPMEIVELRAIRRLVQAGVTVICNGGGGVPVFRDDRDRLRGVEAVIDKDLSGQLLATSLGASKYVILTDVDGVAVDYGLPTQRFLSQLTVEEAREYAADRQFAAGSMGPKVLACCRFVRAGGSRSIIARLDQLDEALRGRAGTAILASSRAAREYEQIRGG